MARRRSIFEIHIDVLRAVRNENRPMRILYKTNLSWITLMECLRNLVEMGLITERHEGKRRRYYITEKGINTLNHVEEFTKEILPILPFHPIQDTL